MRPEFRNFASLCRWAPPLVKISLARQRSQLLADPEAAQAKDLAVAPPADREAAALPGVAAMLRGSQADAWRQGTAGMFDHSRVGDTTVGIRPTDVTVPATIWHGSADPEILPAMAQHLAREMPQARLTILPGEGHLLLFAHWTAILRALTAGQLAAQADA